MTDTKKCANPACTCVPPEKEKYCSPHCEAMAGQVAVICECGHPHCGGAA